MSEQNIWSGSSSQWKNFWPFVSCILILPIPWAIYRWLLVKTMTYALTTERLLTSRGILSKTTDSLELYRVQDFETTQSLFERMAGLHTISLVTGDATSPRVLIDCIPASAGLPDIVRKQVEECRMRKRVRTVDVDDTDSMHGGAVS